MSELKEQRWAVMSERGCEATRLPYADAAELVRRLRGEQIRGLCVITETAASHLSPAKTGTNQPSSNNHPERPHRAAKK
ncbi:MAG: hypothetical protein LC754_18095 [Acidobacteria bacterium]|nr:hypothetical protein [Acidobacteriota bacterium]